METKEKCSLLIDRLYEKHILQKEEYLFLIENKEKCKDELFQKARETADKVYGKDIYIRGLIEFSSWCRNDCLYCGLRRSNRNAERYRLSEEQILYCTETGYQLGFRTFVLQGGEDPWYTDERMESIVRNIKKNHLDCAVTLSLGERSSESYKKLKEAGADRYLLRHETACKKHYEKLHPSEMSFERRMSGIGPFIPHKDTPFKDMEAGTLSMTLFMLGLIRLTLPKVLLPATTALGTIDPMGRELGIMAGANVLMPNLSPGDVRKKYMLYDNKICTGDEAAQCIECLKRRIEKTGCRIVTDRGDSKGGNDNDQI